MGASGRKKKEEHQKWRELSLNRCQITEENRDVFGKDIDGATALERYKGIRNEYRRKERRRRKCMKETLGRRQRNIQFFFS